MFDQWKWIVRNTKRDKKADISGRRRMSCKQADAVYRIYKEIDIFKRKQKPHIRQHRNDKRCTASLHGCPYIYRCTVSVPAPSVHKTRTQICNSHTCRRIYKKDRITRQHKEKNAARKQQDPLRSAREDIIQQQKHCIKTKEIKGCDTHILPFTFMVQYISWII